MSNIRKTVISNCEKNFLLKNLLEGTRLDGRRFDHFRDVHIEFGKDWGCCYVSLGKTKVLAQVSCDVQVPKSSRPSEGMLNINVELNPMADSNFEAGRQSDLSVQLNRLLEKCLKDSKAVDLESLCIKVNEKVWALRVDVNVLNHEGNILDCASIAALASLAHFRRPDVTCDGEEFKIHSYKQKDPIPIVIHHYPVCITYAIFKEGDFILADPTFLEEAVADATLSVGLNAYKELCGFHLGGNALLLPDVILSTANKAAGRAAEFVDLIKKAVEDDNIKRERDIKTCGFHTRVDTENIIFPLEDLSLCIDQWSNKKKKENKRKKSKHTGETEMDTTLDGNNENMEQEINTEKVQNDNLSAEVQDIGEGTAALVPTGLNSKWNANESEDEAEDDVMFVETPKPKTDTVELLDSDSEEDVVVVLNADKKTKKKKSKI